MVRTFSRATGTARKRLPAPCKADGSTLAIRAKSTFVAPEPIEEKLARLLPAAQQVVVLGNGRGYLCILVTGELESAAVQAALGAVNPELPHYRQIRNYTIVRDEFTPESGLLTANGKIRRDAINARYASEIDAMYEARRG